MRGPEEMCDPQTQQPVRPSNERALNKCVDFSDYMWMAEEKIEDFDKKCEEEFWEELLMEEAFEEMLLEEERMSTHYYVIRQEHDNAQGPVTHEYYVPMGDLEVEMHNLNVDRASSRTNPSAPVTIPAASLSHLNPEAPEFVPRSVSPVSSSSDEDMTDCMGER